MTRNRIGGGLEKCYAMVMHTNRRQLQKAAFILQDHKLLPARFFASYSCKALSRLS